MTLTEEKKLSSIMTTAYGTYEKGLVQRAYFKVKDRALSEELVQDTFLKTWSYLKRGGKIEMMKVFLYHILNNLIVDEYRKNKTLSLDALLENGFDQAVQEPIAAYNQLDSARVMYLVEKLPYIYRDVINMRYMKGLSLDEMSLVMGRSKNALGVQIHRGLKMLAGLYSPYR